MSDLLATDVVDARGKRLGRVRDVHLVQDGPLIGTTQARLRIDRVVVGPRAVGIRLGYHRAGVRGPALLRWLFVRLERRASTFAMSDLDWDVERRRLTVRSGQTADTAAGRLDFRSGT